MSRRDWSGWPTIDAYLAWARSAGCKVWIGAPPASETAGLQEARITSPLGKVAIEIFRSPDDPLMSATVARLDRRLSLKSYMFK